MNQLSADTCPHILLIVKFCLFVFQRPWHFTNIHFLSLCSSQFSLFHRISATFFSRFTKHKFIWLCWRLCKYLFCVSIIYFAGKTQSRLSDYCFPHKSKYDFALKSITWEIFEIFFPLSMHLNPMLFCPVQLNLTNK